MTRAYNTATTQQNSGGAVNPFAAGKNKIINGDFGIWQRGTTFTNPASGSFSADRWRINYPTAPTSHEITRQTFTPGAAPVAGYESQYFYRYSVTTAGASTYIEIKNRLEDVRTFAGETVTYSFWAKADSARTINIWWEQNFGSGGSSGVATSLYPVNVTTSWARYSVTINVPSVSGKTIGANSMSIPAIRVTTADGLVLDLWGAQAEAGSVATAFQTATGTIQGELAACQRYYFLEGFGKSTVGRIIGTGGYFAANDVNCVLFFPVTMRTTPSLVVATGTNYYSFTSAGGGTDFINSLTIINSSPTAALLYNVSEAAGTAGQSAFALVQSTSGSIAFNAEL